MIVNIIRYILSPTGTLMSESGLDWSEATACAKIIFRSQMHRNLLKFNTYPGLYPSPGVSAVPKAILRAIKDVVGGK